MVKEIKVTKKQSDRFLKNLKKSGIKLKTKKIKSIVIHQDFDRGMRLCLCLRCGYPIMYQGIWDYPCEICSSKRVKVYNLDQLDEFIRQIQNIVYKNRERKK